MWETLFPGTSPVWSYFGGLALVGWTYFLVQDLLLFWKGSPYIGTFISTPNVNRAYGVPGDFSDVLRLINPGWVWVYAAPAVLFVVNVILVFREKLFRKNA